MDSLPIGTEIDLLDENDVYCPAVIVNHTPLQINYLGWGQNWNETLKSSDFHRIQFPAGKYVKKYKGWVRYHRELPHWPSLIYIRQPKEGSRLGVNYLKEELKVFVKPFGEKVDTIKQMKPYAAGAWINSANIWSTTTNLVKRWKENGLEPSPYREMFASGIEEMEASNALELSFKFHGSYDLSQVKRGRKAATTVAPASAASVSSSSSVIMPGSGGGCAAPNSSSAENTSSSSLSALLLNQRKNEIRTKVFSVLSPDFVPILQSHLPPPSARAIQFINEGLMRLHHGTMSVPLMEEEIFSLSRFFENSLSDHLKKYSLIRTKAGAGTGGGAGGAGGGNKSEVDGSIDKRAKGSKRRKGSCPQRIEMKRKKSYH
jgi:hypothetical protein